MVKIKNKLYRQFIDDGIISTLEEDTIKKALEVIDNSTILKKGIPQNILKEQAKVLVLILYYTGARPAEVLELRSKAIKKKVNNLIIQIPPKKRGLPRPVYLNLKNPLIKTILNYSIKVYPEMLLFNNFRTKYIRRYTYKKDGVEFKGFRIEYTDGLRYYFKKWFSFLIEGGIPPYFLRHNRFSRLSEEGASAEEIRFIKGSRTLESVTPYVHLSSKTAIKLSKKIK
jgi:integrase